LKYRIRRTTQFKKDVKGILRSGKDIEKLLFVIKELAEGHSLPEKYHDHQLKGTYKDKRDCHIEPDWLLIYSIEDDELALYRTGSHADIFE
jgi:mRNA interferase YafQ